jgi:hypothetical protein
LYLVALGVNNILRSSTAVDGALSGCGGGGRRLDGFLSGLLGGFFSSLLDGLLGSLHDGLLSRGPGGGGSGRRGSSCGLLGGSISRGGAGRPVPGRLKFMTSQLVLNYL